MAVYVYKDKKLIALSPTDEYLINLVNKNILNVINLEEKASYENAVKLSHTHKDVDLLDNLTYSTENNELFYKDTLINEKISDNHIVDVINDTITTTLTEEEKNKYNDCVEQSHSHDNKEILDNFSYDGLNNRLMYGDTPLSGNGLMEGEVKTLIEQTIPVILTKEDKNNYDDAYNCMHEHSNKEFLDSLSYNSTSNKLMSNEQSIGGLSKEEVNEILDERVPITILTEEKEKYDNTSLMAHEHENANILSLFSCDGNTLMFNGEVIYTLKKQIKL